ncbi:MAG: DUF4232 domain-containing protein [Solirubrobacteraceae bacterium]
MYLDRPPKTCAGTQLRMSRRAPVEGLLGVEVLPVVFANLSAQPCRISGYPDVQALNARRARVHVKIVQGAYGPKEPQRVSRVILAAHGGRGVFGVSFIDHPAGSGKDWRHCHRFRLVRARLPGERAFHTVSFQFGHAKGTEHWLSACDELLVSPLGPAG